MAKHPDPKYPAAEASANSMGMEEATEQAKRYKMPGPTQFIRFPRVEVYLAFLKLHDLDHLGFDREVAVVRHKIKEAAA